MIFLGAVELGGGHNLRDDWPMELAGLIEASLRFLGGLPLVLVGVKNDRSILGPDIRSLPVERGRIVNLPKDFEQLLERHARWIVFDLDHFGVSRLAAADRPIVRLRDGAARVADGYIDDALDCAKS